MKLTRILSDRHFQTWPSWHIVYEWEDEISRSLNIPIEKSPEIKTFPNPNFIQRKINGLDHRILHGRIEKIHFEISNYTQELSLYFEMHPVLKRNFSNHRRTIPVIVDFWNKSNIEQFKKAYKKCPYLLITNLEVLQWLKKNKIKNHLIHFPMSLPTKYFLDPAKKFNKKYDLVLAGRVNPVLWGYLRRFEIINPEIEYLYQIQKNGELYYKSNKRGIIKKVHSRNDYINLIKAGRIAFYATPGIDGGEKRTNGFNPVTPRFFELLSAGCHIISRYPKTIETDFYELEKISPSANSYEQFEKQIITAIKSELPIKRNSEFLRKHYTSVRTEILKEIE